jgi:hypothetical protein
MATQFKVDCALMAGNVYQATRAPINWIPALFGWIVILILGISMNAQAQLFRFDGKTMSWKEEVLLHDGQIIIAERFYNLGGYPTIDSSERVELDQTVTFNLPGTHKKIIWKTNYHTSTTEPNSLNLILFDMVNGVPYIATFAGGCLAYEKWNRPNPPQILFKHENHQWIRVPLSEFPTQLSKANVIVGRPSRKLWKPFYSVAQVNEENRNLVNHGVVIRKPLVPGLCPRELSGPIPPSFRAQ